MSVLDWLRKSDNSKQLELFRRSRLWSLNYLQPLLVILALALVTWFFWRQLDYGLIWWLKLKGHKVLERIDSRNVILAPLILIAFMSYKALTYSTEPSVLSRQRLSLSRLMVWLSFGLSLIGCLAAWLLLFDSPDRWFTAPVSIYVAFILVIVECIWKLPQVLARKYRGTLELKDLVSLENNYRTLLLQATGGILLLGGLYFTAQNLSVSQQNITLSLRRDASERIARATSQLKDDNLESRLTAIYTIESVAPESYENYRIAMEVLTAFVRTRAPWIERDSKREDRKELGRDIQAVIRFLGEHNQFIDIPKLLPGADSWQGISIDLARLTFETLCL